MCRSTVRILIFIVAIALSQANAVPQQAPSETTAAVSPEDVKLLLQRLQDLEAQVAALKTQVNRITENSGNPSAAVSVPPVPEPATAGCNFVATGMLGGIQAT